MTTVAIATYNMSFVSDSGLDPDGNGNFASEATFLKSIPKNESGVVPDRRLFWKNAFELVKKFWNEVPNAGAMGFQELNKTAEGSGTGSDALATFAKEKGLAFAVDEIVVNANMKPAAGVMWNPKMFGDYKSHMIQDLDYAFTEVKVNPQKGRPFLAVTTTGGFTLVSLHAPNNELIAESTQADFRKAIFAKLEAVGATPEKTFIMGDFNDRYDALTSIDVPGGTLTYTGRAPLSCCHNWDSSCSDSRYKDISERLGRVKVGTCTLPTYKVGNTFTEETLVVPSKQENWRNKEYKLAGPGPRTTMGDEGNIENYRYYGDKVFGLKPVSNIQMYPPGRTGASKESDHEPVMAEYEIPAMAGGKRRGKKHTRKHKGKHGKKRHTRKH